MAIAGKLIEIDLQVLDGLPPVVSPILPLPQALLARGAGEEAFQKSLARHTEFFPLIVDTHHGNWHRWVIAKYELPSKLITDFAYVVTTSVENKIVLVEIEDPEKPMWVGAAHKPSKSAPFVAALEQVERWRSDLQNPAYRQQVIDDMAAMMGQSGMLQNDWTIEYVLVYGRSAENNSMARKRMYADLARNSGIKLATYDHLITANANGQTRIHNVVKMSAGRSFSYAYLNREPNYEFSYLANGSLLLDANAARLFTSYGYNIAAWRNGQSLQVNGKQPLTALPQIVATVLTSNP